MKPVVLETQAGGSAGAGPQTRQWLVGLQGEGNNVPLAAGVMGSSVRIGACPQHCQETP